MLAAVLSAAGIVNLTGAALVPTAYKLPFTINSILVLLASTPPVAMIISTPSSIFKVLPAGTLICPDTLTVEYFFQTPSTLPVAVIGSLLLTVIEQVAISIFSTEVAVMVELPGLIAVINPFATFAIVVSELAQVTALLVAFKGKIVLTNVAVSPGFRLRDDLDKEIPFTVRSTSFLQPSMVVIANKAMMICFFMFILYFKFKT